MHLDARLYEVGGPVATPIQRRGKGTDGAGFVVGTGMWLVVDEGANVVLGLTPPAPEWPFVTHIPALAAHLVYGVALGGLLTLGDPALGE